MKLSLPPDQSLKSDVHEFDLTGEIHPDEERELLERLNNLKERTIRKNTNQSSLKKSPNPTTKFKYDPETMDNKFDT
jgi:hypothetical protein